MAKRRANCEWIPHVAGIDQPSKMYQDLSKLIKNRPLTNYVYANYLQAGVADKMDSLGYKRNAQGQHSARNVYAFFEVHKMKSSLDPKAQAKSLGFMDASDNLVDFDAAEAYTKAKDFNDNNKGRLAYVVQHGDKFNVLIDSRDSRTQIKEAEVNRAIIQWNTLSSELTKRGIDISVLNQINPALVNHGTVADFMRNLGVYKFTPNDALSVKDIEMLLELNNNVPIVKNILNRGWGTREETAQRIYNELHSPTSNSIETLVNNVLNTAKVLPNFNLNELRTELNNATASFNASDTATNIQQILNELDEKYHIESEVYLRKGEAITRYSEAVVDAIMSLERQIRRLEREKGSTTRGENLKVIRDKLAEELQQKRYASGLADFMNTALGYAQAINNNLNSVAPTGTGLEYAHNLAAHISQANNLLNAYYKIVEAVADSNLLNDLSLTDSDRDSLKTLAKSLKEQFDSQRAKVRELEREGMASIGREFIGEHNSLYAKDLVDIIDMAEGDSSIMDYLYSVGRNSNVVVSMLGAIIRDAQDSRDRKLAEYAEQINKLNYILVKDGKDSSFMYDKKGKIVSPYDWDAYFKARGKYKGSLIRSGIKEGTLEFDREMEMWERDNTVEIEVDHTNHRVERMPAFYLTDDYRAGWSAAQNEYYDKMMEIKGRIGSLLPNYAQHQYIAPQKRTSWDQVLKEGLRGERSFSNMLKWFLENSKIWKIKEGTGKFGNREGIIIDGESYTAATSDYDNSVLRQIPLFFVKKIDENNLSHDFSSAIQALASTALNYEAMSNIKDVAEMMTDYSMNTAPTDTENGNQNVDIAHVNDTWIAKTLKKVSGNTSTMMNAFVQKFIYGEEFKDKSLWATICMNLIGYTSFKGLALNVAGALTNKYVGVLQTMIMATRGQYYNFKDLAKAEALLLGEQGASTAGMIAGGVVGGVPGAAIGAAVGTAIGVKGMTGKFLDILTNTKTNKDTLIGEFFDAAQELYSSLSDTRYHSTMFGKLYGSFNPMAMYSRGEYFIHMLNVYATLFHENVIQYDPTTGERKKISLYEALEMSDKEDGNRSLKIKDNIYRIDGVKLNDLSDEYFSEIRRRIRYVNQQCHGAMNKEDKGLIHQWALGKMAMNFRQWMVEHYSRRFRTLHWDESIRDVNLSNFYNNTKVLLNGKKVNLIDALEMVDNGTGDNSFHYDIKSGVTTLDGNSLTSNVIDTMLEKYAEDAGWRRGFKNDAFVILKDFIKEARDYQISASIFWNQLSETQKGDVKETLGEIFSLLALMGLGFCMGDPDDHNGEFWYKLWMYVVKRVEFDQRATNVVFLPKELKTLIQSPFASTQTVSGLLYPVYGLINGDYKETIMSGRNAGQNKYVKNLKKYTLPFYHQIDQMLHLDEESYVFNTFDNQITR